jgi:hypothetical protein
VTRRAFESLAVRTDAVVLDVLLREHATLNDLPGVFSDAMFDLGVVTPQWLMLAYAETLPRAVLLRVWALFFAFGARVLLATALALLHALADRLRESDDFGTLFVLLRKPPSDGLEGVMLSALLDELRVADEDSNLTIPGPSFEPHHPWSLVRRRVLAIPGPSFVCSPSLVPDRTLAGAAQRAARGPDEDRTSPSLVPASDAHQPWSAIILWQALRREHRPRATSTPVVEEDVLLQLAKAVKSGTIASGNAMLWVAVKGPQKVGQQTLSMLDLVLHPVVRLSTPSEPAGRDAKGNHGQGAQEIL